MKYVVFPGPKMGYVIVLKFFQDFNLSERREHISKTMDIRLILLVYYP